MLRSYSLPTFHHLPLWKNEPFDHEVDEGVNVEINCSAIVGPQYNSIKLQPVRAYWENPKVHLDSKVFPDCNHILGVVKHMSPIL